MGTNTLAKGFDCDGPQFPLPSYKKRSTIPKQMSMSYAASKPLFTPGRLGAIETKNRIVMAAMTRSRADRSGVPSPLAARYYSQRADAGLIIAEMTQVSQQGQGYASTPGIHSKAQIEGWQAVTDAVHQVGGRILLQLGHAGRISHPSLQPDGALPVAPSAVRPNGKQIITYEGLQPMVEPRPLKKEEIAAIIAAFAAAARNAIAAGFDGVELHAGNGYIFEQFLRNSTNRRDDLYGGSIENRARFLFEITDAVAAAIGRERIGVHLSPFHLSNDVSDSDPAPLFLHVARGLGKRQIAFLHVILDLPRFPPEVKDKKAADTLSVRQIQETFGGVFMANGGFDGLSGAAAIAAGEADFVSFGRPYLSNPDLVGRIRSGAAFRSELDKQFWYGGQERGYTEFP